MSAGASSSTPACGASPTRCPSGPSSSSSSRRSSRSGQRRSGRCSSAWRSAARSRWRWWVRSGPPTRSSGLERAGLLGADAGPTIRPSASRIRRTPTVLGIDRPGHDPAGGRRRSAGRGAGPPRCRRRSHPGPAVAGVRRPARGRRRRCWRPLGWPTGASRLHDAEALVRAVPEDALGFDGRVLLGEVLRELGRAEEADARSPRCPRTPRPSGRRPPCARRATGTTTSIASTTPSSSWRRRRPTSAAPIGASRCTGCTGSSWCSPVASPRRSRRSNPC